MTFQPGLESTRAVFAQDSMGFGNNTELFDDTTVVDTNTSREDTLQDEQVAVTFTDFLR